ncbi:UNVERIFIED_CONTAM: hypothetical protein HDU68_006273 [Siphonaria sp. JEL0065]|nr:hypothetical protein HDU68_006273 [Siphonaria sp. JEL0065]
MLTFVTSLPIPDIVFNGVGAPFPPQHRVFAPSIDVSGDSLFSVSSWIESYQTQHQNLPMAFLIPGISITSAGDAFFNGDPDQPATGTTPFYLSEIKSLQKLVSQIGFSFRGENALDGSRESSRLAGIYKRVLDVYHVSWIDIFFNTHVLTNDTAVAVIVGAVGELQSQYSVLESKSRLKVTFSFALDESLARLSNDTIKLLYLSSKKGLVVDSVVAVMRKSESNGSAVLEARDTDKTSVEDILLPQVKVGERRIREFHGNRRDLGTGRKGRFGITVVEGVSAKDGTLNASGYAIQVLKAMWTQVKPFQNVAGVGFMPMIGSTGSTKKENGNAVVSKPFQVSDALELAVWGKANKWVTFLGLLGVNEDVEGSYTDALNHFR